VRVVVVARGRRLGLGGRAIVEATDVRAKSEIRQERPERAVGRIERVGCDQ